MAFTAPLTSALTDALTKPVNDDYYVGDGVVGFISDLGLEMVFEQQEETQVSELAVEVVLEQDPTSYPAYVNGNTYSISDIVYYSGDGHAYIADTAGTSTGADPKTATGVTWRVYA